MGWETLGALASLFVAAFAAATILPFQSEFVLVGMLAGEVASSSLLVAVASVGNTLGSVANYWMGRYIEHFRGRRWFPVTDAQLERAQGFFRRYGVWTLLLSWAPFGDPVTVIAGLMRTPFLVFLVLVAAAKTGRYVFIAWAFF